MLYVGPNESFTTPKEDITGLPKFGWRVQLDYKCKIRCEPFTRPRMDQLGRYIGLSFRYMNMWLKKKRDGRKMFIDHLNPVRHRPIFGCPIGGIGAGTIGRGYQGQFCRFHMVPGLYDHTVVMADQFIVCIRKRGSTVYQQVLSSQKKKGGSLKAWQWHFPGAQATYQGLYPRAWTVFNIPEHGVRLVCRQISPVYPHEYQETSLPCAAFVWTVENTGTEPVDVSIAFTFKNGRGVAEDRQGGCWNEPFTCDSEGAKAKGVLLHQDIRGMACTYAVAACAKEGSTVSHQVAWDPQSSGSDIWDCLQQSGRLPGGTDRSTPTPKGKETAAAVCCGTRVQPGGSAQLDFCLAWDMPIIQFSSKERQYARRYARWFGRAGNAGPRLCSHTLAKYPMWEQKIEEWQTPILENSKLPAWYKSALFNELYFVSDGGTLWVDPVEAESEDSGASAHELVQEYSKFVYLEGHEYRMFNTYDVHHYASFALIMLWPKIQLSLQYDIADAVELHDPVLTKYLMSGERGFVKPRNTVPHDVGDPEDEPWKRVNAYRIHPTYDWKDLNLKFVLQVYRDYYATQDTNFLRDMYPRVKTVIETALLWDKDDDGIIDNSGFPDQTFDAWVMLGASAYCGGMWLAALRMFVEMAELLGRQGDKDKYQEVLDRGCKSFEKKLWNGKYYDYDSSENGHHDSIMADQLAGHWYLRASGLHDDKVFPEGHVRTALKTIFENNVQKFGGGNMGAINGTRPDGSMDCSSCQSEEFWTGVTYALAAAMIQEGLVEEAFQTAWGAYYVCWEQRGLQYQTPEAYMVGKFHRSLGYMRPLAVWAMQWALEHFQPQLCPPQAGSMGHGGEGEGVEADKQADLATAQGAAFHP